jgi:hypothetical protein
MAQTTNQAPFDDIVYVQDVQIQVPGRLPNRNQIVPIPISPNNYPNALNLVLPQPPNSVGDLQQVIDKAMTDRSNTVLAMDLDSVMLTKGPLTLTATNDPDGTLRGIVSGLKSIQLRMFDVEGDVRSKLQAARDLLKAPRWVRYSAFKSKNEEIEIWAARWRTSPTGVFLLSISGQRVFTMNVAGVINPDQLVYLSGAFGMPNFKPKLDVPLDSPAAGK